MKRLLIFYSSHNPVCGVGSWINLLESSLKGQGWQVTVALTQGMNFHKPEYFRRRFPHIESIVLDGRNGTTYCRRQAIRDAVDAINPDIAMVTLLDDAMRELADLRTRGGVDRLVVVSHDNAAQHLAAILEMLPSVDSVVTVNRISGQLLRDWFDEETPGRVASIPNTVRQAMGQTQARSLPLKIAYVGRLSRDKGFDFLPEVIEGLGRSATDFKFGIFGDGPLRGLARELDGRYKQVTYAGVLDQDELYARIYPSLHGIFCCSPSEGWPIAMAEGMANGVVPVTSAYLGIGLEGVIRHGETGLIYPVGDAATAVRLLLELPQQFEPLSHNVRREITTRFNPDVFAERWMQYLAELTGTPNPDLAHYKSGVDLTPWIRMKEWIRSNFGLRLIHQSPRSEWPLYRTDDAAMIEKVERTLMRLGGADAG